MTIYYTASVIDISGEDYYPIIVKTINEVIEKHTSEIFGNYSIPNLLLDSIKDGIAANIDQFIEFPTEFIFDIYNIDNVEQELWNNLAIRAYNALVYQLTKNVEFCFDFKDDLDLQEYNVKSWEEYVLNITENFIVIGSTEDSICYIEDTNYYPVEIGEDK